MKKKLLFLSLLFLIIFSCVPRVFPAKVEPFDPLPTEFVYSTERLCHYRSPQLLTLEKIDRWEAPLQHYCEEKNISYPDQLRFYTYLYLAEKDAVFLSYNVHRCFIGSLDPLIEKVVCAFFPDFDAFPECAADLYSEQLAQCVWPFYQRRLETEHAGWIPWTSFLPTIPPPEKDLKKEVQNMEAQRLQLSDEEVQLVYAWSGEKGMHCYWWAIANQFMREKNIPLGKTIFDRALLMLGLYDTLIAVEKAKTLYCVPRPIEIDSTICPLVPTPQSFSYPSGHAAQAGVASVILSFFFPKELLAWEKIARDAAVSRIWAGVHTPQDIIQGMQLGENVGEHIIYPNKLKN